MVIERGTSTTTPFDPATWRDRRELAWRSTLRPNTSPGIVARHLLAALQRRGVHPRVVPAEREQLPAELSHLAAPASPDNRLAFVLHYRANLGALPNERIVHYTMRETTAIEPLHVQRINARADLLLVPCAQNRDDFLAAGIQAPVRVLHHGIDPLAFPLLRRERGGDEPFTFGTFGILSHRKGIDILLRAFQAEFAAGEPVRLLLKSQSAPELPHESATLLGDPRVEVVRGFVDQRQLLELLRRLDAFVLPSRGEGFGMGGLEALATGLPLIATDWSGPVEYLDPADCYPLRYRLVPATAPRAGQTPGYWAEPDEAHLRALLRHIYEHQDEAAARGRAAARRVQAGWTWDRVAGDLVSMLDAVARGMSPG